MKPERLEQLQTLLQPDRAFEFQQNPELQAFYRDVKSSPQMQRLGYDSFVSIHLRSYAVQHKNVGARRASPEK